MLARSKTSLGLATFLLSMSLAATGCDDPAEGKAKAKVVVAAVGVVLVLVALVFYARSQRVKEGR